MAGNTNAIANSPTKHAIATPQPGRYKDPDRYSVDNNANPSTPRESSADEDAAVGLLPGKEVGEKPDAPAVRWSGNLDRTPAVNASGLPGELVPGRVSR